MAKFCAGQSVLTPIRPMIGEDAMGRALFDKETLAVGKVMKRHSGVADETMSGWTQKPDVRSTRDDLGYYLVETPNVVVLAHERELQGV